MQPQTTHYFVATNVLLEKEGKILLSLRQNTGWADGQMTIPGGHTEPGETVIQAALREAKEELGLDLDPADLTYLCTENKLTNRPYLSVIFIAKTDQTPQNTEPEKCKELVWVDAQNLPENVTENFKAIIRNAYLGTQKYLEHIQ
jgi:8-oxo-dGTP pyrophosphatase MutT (NUDIX family)